MAAVGFALCSAVLFGGLSVALGFAMRVNRDAEMGALVTSLIAVLICGTAAAIGGHWRGQVWPFLLAGLLAPGGSQMLYLVAIRMSGPSRTAVVVGVAPLVSVSIALIALGEPLKAPLILGAVLIVLGGLALAAERVRPTSFRRAGLLFAFGSAAFFATRDNVVRHLATGTSVPPLVAASATLVAGSALMALYLIAVRRRRFAHDLSRAVRPYALGGLLWGSSYVTLFEAFYRGRVSIVSPLVATESLVGVLCAALLLRRTELVGRHLVVGALLIVAGGALIGGFR